MDELSLQQLHEIDTAFEEFFFSQPIRGESWSPTYKQDPKLFKKIIAELVSFKRDLMKYQRDLYANRWNLIDYYAVPLKKMDELDDQYFNQTQWDQQNQQLAQVIEQHKKRSYELGILAILLLLRTKPSISVDDVQLDILTQSLRDSTLINETTKKRIASTIKSSTQLGEDRTAFEGRLKQVIVNNDRADMIASQEALTSYLDAKQTGAVDLGFRYKTWIGNAPTDSICGDVNGDTIPIGADFGNGLPGPLGHINCKCDLMYSNNADGS